MKLGRRLKGESRRVPITIHAPINILNAIDAHVDEHAAEVGSVYSRSDFYNEAANALLRSRGVEVSEEPERTQSVPKNGRADEKQNNENNLGKTKLGTTAGDQEN